VRCGTAAVCSLAGCER